MLRCRFRSEETLRINLGLHMNLVGSLLLLNLAFLLNSRLSRGSQAGTCKVLAGLTHYCLLCCFTWMALEGCHLYLLFIKVLGIYIRHYLAKLCLVGWGEHHQPGRELGGERGSGLQPEGERGNAVMGRERASPRPAHSSSKCCGQGWEVSYVGLVHQTQGSAHRQPPSRWGPASSQSPGVFVLPLPALRGSWVGTRADDPPERLGDTPSPATQRCPSLSVVPRTCATSVGP